MVVVLQQVPSNRRVVIPLLALADLAAHEQQLLARMRPHVRKERARVREALPLVARHFAQQRPLPVHHLVMRDRQHEILGERVEQAEREVVVMVLAMTGSSEK